MLPHAKYHLPSTKINIMIRHCSVFRHTFGKYTSEQFLCTTILAHKQPSCQYNSMPVCKLQCTVSTKIKDTLYCKDVFDLNIEKLC